MITDSKEYVVCVVVDATKKKPYTFIIDENYNKNNAIENLNSIWKKYYSVKAKNYYWAERLALLKYEEEKKKVKS